MKNFVSLIVAFLFTLTCTASEPVAVLSINVRCSTAGDGENAWSKRKDFMMDVVRQGNYDFIGGQEVVVHPNDDVNQYKFMGEKLSEYGSIFLSREKDPMKGEGTPVFYRKDRWELDAEEHGTFWLSDTPNEPGAVTWKGQSTCPRVVSWGLFHELVKDSKRTSQAIYVFNTHFDHVGEMPRQKAANMILQRISERKQQQVPAVLMGDLNCGEKSPSIRFLLGETVVLDGVECKPPFGLIDTFRTVHSDATDVGTFHGFSERVSANKIDYILVSDGLKATDAEIIRTKNAEGRYPSDHFPIRAVVKFENN